MKSTRVALVNLGRRGSYRLVSPPLGLLYLASYARSRLELDIAIVDQRAEDCSDQAVVDRIKEFNPGIVGLSCFTSHGHMLDPMTHAIRAALPDALQVIGGSHVSSTGAAALEACAADVAVVGEGELAFEAIIRAEGAGDGFGAIPGVIWRDADGQVVTNPGASPAVDDLDALPLPAFDLLDVPKYWRLWSQSPIPPPRKFVPMFTSRGCPYKCIYCHNVFGKRFRAHSAQRVADEIEHYVKTFGIEEIEFFDDSFNLDRRRVIEISEELNRRNLRIKLAFPNSLRTDLLTEEVIEALVDAGLYSSAFALESGSARVQEFIQKRLNIDKYLAAVDMAVRRRVFSYGFLMFGFPTETEEEVEETIVAACRSRLHAALFYRVVPYPQTALWDLMERDHPEKLAQISFADTDYTYRPTINCSDIPTPVLDAHVRRGVVRFYLNPPRLLRMARDYPKPHCLPLYLPRVLFHLVRRSPKQEPAPA